MPNENEGGNPRGDPPPDPSLPNPTAPQGGIPGGQQTTETEANLAAAETRRELHWLEKLNFASQISLVIVGIIAASIYGRQLRTMNQQLGEMSEATYVSCLSAQTAQQTLKEIQTGGIDSHNIAVGTITQAAAVTRAEAAQITVQRSSSDLHFNEGEELMFPFTFKNIGHSAALDIEVRAVVALVEYNKDPSFRYDKKSFNILQIGALEADTPIEPPLSFVMLRGGRPAILTRYEVEDVAAGTVYWVQYARITYRDIFGASHWVQDCITSRHSHSAEEGDGTKKCAAYNGSDLQTLPRQIPPSPPHSSQMREISCRPPADAEQPKPWWKFW